MIMTSYQTPDDVVQVMRELLTPGMDAFDPCCGRGVLARGVDLERDGIDSLAQPLEGAPFDQVIMNPPFDGHYQGVPIFDTRSYTRHDQLFLLRGLDLLKEGGALIMLIPDHMLYSDVKGARDLRSWLITHHKVTHVIGVKTDSISASVIRIVKGHGPTVTCLFNGMDHPIVDTSLHAGFYNKPTSPENGVALSEVAALRSGPSGALLKKVDYSEKGVPLWSSYDDGAVKPRFYVPYPMYDRLDGYRVEPRDILVTRAGSTCGKAYLAPEAGIMHTGVIRVRMIFRHDPRPVCDYLNLHRDHARVTIGAKFTHVSCKTLGAVIIPYASLI
jgi:hypothetical protein